MVLHVLSRGVPILPEVWEGWVPLNLSQRDPNTYTTRKVPLVSYASRPHDTHTFWAKSSLCDIIVNKAMFIGGYNTERTTTTAPPPAPSARHEHASSPDSAASPIPSRHANSPLTSLASRHFPHAIAAISNRHSVRLENVISCRKQTIASCSNRHFFTPFSAEMSRVMSSDHASFTIRLALRRLSRTLPAISNRQWQILENDVSHRKQTLAHRSNRQLFAILKPASARVISSDRASHNARRAPLPTHYNPLVPCDAHAPKPLTTP
jgi:hypothetical protein